MMKHSIIYIAIAGVIALSACEEVVDGLDKNPTAIEIDDIEAGLYINTPEINLVSVVRGLNGRMAPLWTGQFVGVNQFPLAYYRYELTESTFGFGGYQSVITQCKHIQSAAPDNALYQGLTRVLEAYLFGFYASAFGDVPATEVSTDVAYPRFESQKSVFAYVQQLLDEAIAYFGKVTSPSYKQDYLFNGDVAGWTETAYTLKARFYTITKEYEKALQSAQKGISDPTRSLLFRPVDDSKTGNKNNLYEYAQNKYFGTEDAEGKQSFLFDVLDARNNSKTDETARKAYYYIDPNNEYNKTNGNHGIASALEPEPLVTYEENLLTLAETAARTVGFDEGLSYLNQLREYYDAGGAVNSYFASYAYNYDTYTSDDFAAGGLLNPDGLTPERALLREIILERYISGYTQFLPWDDARRLRGAGETDIAVDIPLNTPAATKHPERFYYPEEEILSNPNAPSDPGLYEPTEVNR
ncbi:MAG: SusD/RagB family nutrient-binding outer membrane lipoprotein [Bacteroidales bacterium]|nr:SusD/RagB family nutrient-binding outer membrane lipoprotein [Bacteroidales bacterium]